MPAAPAIFRRSGQALATRAHAALRPAGRLRVALRLSCAPPARAAIALAVTIATIAVVLAAPPTPAMATSVPVVGQTDTFVAEDWSAGLDPIQAQAAAQYVGEHCIIYVQQGQNVPKVTTDALGGYFDSTTFPSVTSALGAAPDPGIDGLAPIVILIYDFHAPATYGYFDPADIDPAAGTHSNRRDMFYLNSSYVLNNGDAAGSVAAHEFAHLIAYYRNYMLDPSPKRAPEATWLMEGFATYAEHVAGYDGRTNGYLLSLADNPNVDLTLNPWPEYQYDYGASYAFVSYMVGQEGPGFLSALVDQTADGIAGINAVLRARGSSDTFDSLFDDWIATDFLDGRPPAVWPYSIPDVSISATADMQTGDSPNIGSTTVTNFGARYLDFPATSPDAAFSAVVGWEDGAPIRAALISWDSAGIKPPSVDRLGLATGAVGGKISALPGYDRHTLAVWARGVEGAQATYKFSYNAAADPPAGIQFLDMGGSDPYYPYVAGLLTRHVISGKEIPPGSGLFYFRGGDSVLRQQFAKMIVLALGLPVSVNDKCPFPDVPVGSDPSDPLYADHYIAVAASHGIVSGYDNGRFGPQDAITRIQLVRMIVNGAAAAGKPFPTYTGTQTVFADVTPANPFYRPVMAAYKAGILGGSEGPDGRLYFLPWSTATRDHVAKMTANLVNYLEGSGG